MIRTRRLLGTVALCALIPACGGDEAPPEEAARPVAVTTIERMVPDVGIHVTGVAEPYRETELGFEVGGRITRILDVGRSVEVRTEVDEGGTTVQVGDRLATIDDTSYRQRRDAAKLKLATAQAGLRALMIDLEEVAPATVARAKAQRDAALADVEAARAGVASAESTRKTAESDLNRNRPLLREERISPAEFDQLQRAYDTALAAENQAKARLEASGEQVVGLEATVAEAEASLRLKTERVSEANAQIREQLLAVEQAQTDLDRCVLRAPFSGRITFVHASQGDLVTVGQPVLRLTLIDPIKVSATVSADLERRIQPGHHARVTPRDMRASKGEKIELFGTVFEKGAVADPATRTFRIDVMVRNARRSLVETDDPKVTTIEFRNLLPVVRRLHGEPGPLFVCTDCLVDEDEGTFVYRLKGASFGQPRPDSLFAGTLPLERIQVATASKAPEDFMRVLNWGFQRLEGQQTPMALGDGDLLMACRQIDKKAIDFDAVVMQRHDWYIRPGDLVPVTFRGESATQGIWIPDAGIVAQNDARTVYAVVDGTAKAIAVTVHESQGRLRRVTGNGLTQGAQVVIVGAQYVYDGAPVTVTRSIDLQDWIRRQP